MTFLELCKKLRLMAGVSGTGPVTVENQQGQLLELVTLVNQAWVQLQNARPNWNFMWNEFSFTTTPGQRDYSGADAGASDLARWGTPLRRYPLLQGPAFEGWLQGLAFHHWQARYGIGDVAENVPVAFTVLPDNTLRLAPTPNGAYVISGTYYRDSQPLVNNDDVPLLPARFHDLIVYLALTLYGLSQEAPTVVAHGQAASEPLLTQLERDALPPLEGADSLSEY